VQFPVWIGVGRFAVHPHLFFELLAYTVATQAYYAARRRLGDHVSAADRWSLTAAAILGALIGSRALFWLEDPRQTLAHLDRPFFLVGGQTIVGALAGGWLAVEWQKRQLRIDAPTGDLLAVPIALGIAIGRLGCFLSGLPDGTYGLPTSLPVGIDLGDGIPRHPAALYESIFMFALAWVLSRAHRRMRKGETFLLFIGVYFAFRLLIEFLKPRVPLGGLTAIQWTALAGIVVAAGIARYRRQMGAPKLPETL
jgi:prolipoprotein diacylglyceryltransferase